MFFTHPLCWLELGWETIVCTLKSFLWSLRHQRVVSIIAKRLVLCVPFQSPEFQVAQDFASLPLDSISCWAGHLFDYDELVRTIAFGTEFQNVEAHKVSLWILNTSPRLWKHARIVGILLGNSSGTAFFSNDGVSDVPSLPDGNNMVVYGLIGSRILSARCVFSFYELELPYPVARWLVIRNPNSEIRLQSTKSSFPKFRSKRSFINRLWWSVTSNTL